MDLSISRNLFDARLRFFPSIEYSHATVCVCESAGVAGDFKFCSELLCSTPNLTLSSNQTNGRLIKNI